MSKVDPVEGPRLRWDGGVPPDLQSTWRLLVVPGDVTRCDSLALRDVDLLGLLPGELHQNSASGVELLCPPLASRFRGAEGSATNLEDVLRVLVLEAKALEEALREIGAEGLDDRRCDLDARGVGVDESEYSKVVHLRLATLPRHLEVARVSERGSKVCWEIHRNGRWVDVLVVCSRGRGRWVTRGVRVCPICLRNFRISGEGRIRRRGFRWKRR